MPNGPEEIGQRSETVRRANLTAIVRELHAHGPLSRSELVARTGLTRSAIRGLIGELVAGRLASRRARHSARGARSSISAGTTATRQRPSCWRWRSPSIRWPWRWSGSAARSSISSGSSDHEAIPRSTRSSGTSPSWQRADPRRDEQRRARSVSASRWPGSCGAPTGSSRWLRTSAGDDVPLGDRLARALKAVAPSPWPTSRTSARSRSSGAAPPSAATTCCSSSARSASGAAWSSTASRSPAPPDTAARWATSRSTPTASHAAAARSGAGRPRSARKPC